VAAYRRITRRGVRTMRPTIWSCFALLVLVSPGCASSSPPEEDLATVGTDTTPALDTAQSGSLVFDFGPILAHGQTLRHEFTLTNPSNKPVRLLASRSYTPCCSAVESLPELIPPRGDAKVAVLFKPGHQSGLKVVRFAVETDSSEQPARMLIVRARLFSEWEMVPTEDLTASLPIGKTGTQTWRVFCRRKGAQGLRLPESVKVAGPLKASFVGPASVQEQPDGFDEATRVVEVALPAIAELGPRAAELAFLWPDGLEKTHLIRWEIAPRVRMAPLSIVVESSEHPIEKVVTVTSDDGPFRIIKVAGPYFRRMLKRRRLRRVHTT
jgi:Protein of unknown function (DUF1573)